MLRSDRGEKLLLVGILVFLLFFVFQEAGDPASRKSSEYIEAAFFRADKDFPHYEWKEGWSERRMFFPKFFERGGLFYLYIGNPHDREMEIKSVILDGRELKVRGGTAEVVWYRILPNPIPPKGKGEIVIRLRTIPRWLVEIELRTNLESSNIKVKVTPSPPGLTVGYVAFSPNIDRIYVYLEKDSRKSLKIDRIYLDNQDVTSNTKILAPNFYKDISLLVVRLRESLTYGSYHFLKITTRQGEVAATMIRAWDSFFSIGMFGFFTPQEYALYNVNTYNSFGPLPISKLDRLENYNLKLIAPYHDDKSVTMVKDHLSLLAYYLEDEPDVMDYYVDEVEDVMKRIGTYAMEMERRGQFHRITDPRSLNFLMVDNTYKPANWFIYGQIPDILGTDPYALSFGEDPFYVYQATDVARYACAPKPLFVTLQAYWGKGQGFERYPAPEEERLMVYYALAGGAKGISYYVYSTEISKNYAFHGCADDPILLEEIGNINKELRKIAPLLAIGCPVDLVSTSNQNLWARALICGEDAIVLIIVNKDYSSTKETFRSTPLKNAKVRVNLPYWLTVEKVFSTRAHGGEGIAYRKQNDQLEIEIEEIELTELLVLTTE